MSRLVFLVPGARDSSLLQEECCWGRNSRQTPALALNAIAYLRRVLPADSVRVCRPLDATTGTRAMIFSWIFGDDLEADAKRCSVLIANPSSAADAIRQRFPSATVIPAREVFAAGEPMQFAPLADWPHGFDSVLYQTASGCTHRCPYCVWDHTYSRRLPHIAAAEIRRLLQLYPTAAQSDVALLCNEITGDTKWLVAFCGGLGDGLTWRADANVRNATLEQFEIAKAGGLAEVTLGIEALDDELLRTCNKGHAVADAFRVFRWLQSLGIRYRFALRQRIGETPEQLDNQIAALVRMRVEGLRPDHITIGPMDSWPGNVRWGWQLNHGSTNYPRGIRTYGDRTDEIIEGWREIQRLTARLVISPACPPSHAPNPQ